MGQKGRRARAEMLVAQVYDSDTEEVELHDVDDRKGGVLLQHKCVSREEGSGSAVYYYKSEEDSTAWGVYNDRRGVTRCKHCHGVWGLRLK